MASKPLITVRCDKCDKSAAKFDCHTCGEALCETCKARHSKDKGTRRHKIVQDAHKLNPIYLLGLCYTHKTKNPEFWCDTCCVPICLSCQTDNHKGHKTQKTSDMLSEKKDDILEELSNLRNENIGTWEKALKQAQEITTDYQDNIDNIDKELVARAKEMHKQVHSILQESQQSLQQMRNSGLAKLRDQERYLGDQLQQVKEDTSKYEDPHKDGDPNVLLHFLINTRQSITKPPSFETAIVPSFRKGQIDTCAMEEMFGHLSTTEKSLIQNPSVQKEFPVDFDFPCIVCVDEGLAWGETKSKILQLVDREGSIKDTINTDIFLNNIAVTSDGEILLTNFYGCCINSVSKEKKISILFKTGRKPTGLCCLHNDDIMVTFSDDSEVIVYRRSGQIMQALDHIKFRYPRKVAENKVNQDLYICDHEVHNCYSLGRVIAVRADGQQLYEYTGQSGSPFTPVDVCTDYKGHILIADTINHQIHILDKKGSFIQYVLTERQGIRCPNTIAVDREGYVWVGEEVTLNKGLVKVAKYLY